MFEGSENHLRSYTCIGDIVDGFVAVLNNLDTCENFNIGSDTMISTGEGIRIIEELTGKVPQYFRKPKRSRDQGKNHANIEKARRRLIYNPRTTPEEGLAKTVDWYRTNILGNIDF